MRNYLLILTFVFSILIMPAQALAVDFKIEETKIDAYLQENGDVQVTEQYTYQFDGEFNGVTRTLIPKTNTAIKDVQANENGETLTVEKKDELYRIYRAGEDETITVELSYLIKNGVEVYSDLGQFYWPFFDSSNESTYHNMEISIHPPKPSEDTLALGYDQAESTAETAADGTVQFSMGEVSNGEKGDIRVAYEAALFPDAVLVSDSTIREDILADQKTQAEQAAVFENRQHFLSAIAPFLIGGYAAFLLVLMLNAWRKKRITSWEVERSSLHNSFLPKQEMSLPATIYHMSGMVKGGELLSASLMDLVRKGNIQQKRENEFIIVDRNTDHPHEKQLINWLFDKVGQEGSFSPDNLEVYMQPEENKEEYQSDYQYWLNLLKEEVSKSNLYDKKIKMRLIIGLVSIPLIPMMFLFGIYHLPVWIFTSLVLFAGLMIFALLYQPRTLKGARIKYQWEQLTYRYDTINEKEWNEWMNDEQMQAFIYGIGTNNKSMMAKNTAWIKNRSQLQPALESTSGDMMMLLFFSGMLTNQFNQASETVSASTTSIGTGGGAGIGGGGGGSGAF